MAASSRMSRTFARQSPRSRIATIVIGVLKNWASCHPTKPVRLMPCERPPELQNRVQTIRAGTNQNGSDAAFHGALLQQKGHHAPCRETVPEQGIAGWRWKADSCCREGVPT